MSIIQVKYPNINVPAVRGYCLKYVDDGVSAPAREPTATISWQSNPAKQYVDLPVGVWVPIFFSLPKYPQGDLGHVAWAFKHDANWTEVHDSETQPGARPVYRSIAEVEQWFGKYGCEYLGWSTEVDGAVVAQLVTDQPSAAPETGRIAAKGTATVAVDALNVRNAPDKNSPSVAVYGYGQKINYDSYIITNGYVWLSYISSIGVRRYVADGPNDGKDDTTYVTGGV
jgi:hypothetical protein